MNPNPIPCTPVSGTPEYVKTLLSMGGVLFGVILGLIADPIRAGF